MTASMFKLRPCNCLNGIARERLLEVMGGGGENVINVSWLKTWTCFSEAKVSDVETHRGRPGGCSRVSDPCRRRTTLRHSCTIECLNHTPQYYHIEDIWIDDNQVCTLLRTYCMLHVPALRNSTQHRLESYPSCLCCVRGMGYPSVR